MDRKVLRFYCVWDDRDNMFGEINPYVRKKNPFPDNQSVTPPHRSFTTSLRMTRWRSERFMYPMMAGTPSPSSYAVRSWPRTQRTYHVWNSVLSCITVSPFSVHSQLSHSCAGGFSWWDKAVVLSTRLCNWENNAHHGQKSLPVRTQFSAVAKT